MPHAFTTCPRNRGKAADILRIWMVGLFVLAGVFSADARVTQITIQNLQSPIQGGKSFGEVGVYETLTGLVHGEIDPKDPHNQIITDIDLAPRNAHGMVEYTATFTLQKPVNLAGANGVLLYCVPNRGNRISTGIYGVAGESGDEFLMNRGCTVLHSGWQGDLPERKGSERIDVPVARNKDGSSVTGAALARFVNMLNGTNTLSLPSHHDAVPSDNRVATMTKRKSE